MQEWLNNLIFGYRCKVCGSKGLEGFSLFECQNIECELFGVELKK